MLAGAPPVVDESWPTVLAISSGGLPERTVALLAATIDHDRALDDDSLNAAMLEVQATARAMLDSAEAPERFIAAREHWRIVRRVLSFVLMLVVMPFGYLFAQKAVELPDLAKGKPWRASSKFADCHPERIECAGVRTRIFFHTLQEKDPWVEMDLQAPTAFSSVSVYNRTDGVPERAVPLIVEVGDDQKTWRVLGRRDSEFREWKVTFPTTTARYVRVRAPRETLLHLDAVKVHP